MPPLTYIRFLIPKWPLFMLASVISILQLENSPDLSSYDTKDLFDSYDYVIVGAGTAGCVLANRLSADHHRTVLLIEAGGVENAATDIPLFALLHFHGEFDWDYRTEPQQHGCLGMKEHRCDWARGKALGGSSVTNFQLYVRGNKRDFDYWEQRHGAKGWSYKDVLPHFKKFESYKVPNANSELQPAFLKAGEELGFKVVDYNAEDQTGPFSLPAAIEATAFMNTSYGSREYPDFQLYLLSVSGASVEGERFITDLGVRQDIYDAYFKPKRGSSAFNIGIVMNRLKSRGYIKLRSKNYHDTPILDPRYYSHPDDPKMAAQAISQIVNLMKTKALAALGTKLWDVPLPPCKAHSMWSNEYNECMAKHLSPTSWHQCCTNPMGNGNNAVVDPRLRVRGGITGLRVVDASVMPDIVTGNPNAAVYMIGEKGASMILEDNK
ncbi:hypothetical protein HPB52_002205 [Rhipicephalus sanguineus]|uniref:Glucose dehydrogenase n=1 Tax=Rhipicephalus sanguineus TaxID=34632 RepID=A0A9D4T339_RHISA|nr:hypothetical protein HPB52_002205 [Rhipicephalus sanguineus]